MPAERLSMRKVREVLRLKHAHGMSYRKISEATGVGKTQAADTRTLPRCTENQALNLSRL